MSTNSEARKYTRFQHIATILIDNFPDGAYYQAQMVNYSKSGIGMGTNIALQPGRKIVLAIENTPYPSCPGVYEAAVRWCRKMVDYYALYTYGIGVHLLPLKQLQKVESPGENYSVLVSNNCSAKSSVTPNKPQPKPPPPPITENSAKPSVDIDLPPLEYRKHARKSCMVPAQYTFKNGIHWGFAENIGRGGMYLKKYLKNQDTFHVGQCLTIAIPSSKNSQTLKISGEIAWVDSQGCGVRFKRFAS